MTQIGGSTPSYDANGNVTNDFLHTYSWDSNGRPVTIDTVGIIYDALGRMVEQNRSGAYTQIVYAPSGAKLALMNGSTLQKGFVPLAGGAMAVYNSGGLAYYRHSDWLGSSRLASTPTRTIYSDDAYAPFGEPYAQTGATDLSFTGMNQDTVSNLYDFPAREYGIQGRWPSPDPAGIRSVSPSDPQTWNRYVYARNYPLGATDPTGQQFQQCVPCASGGGSLMGDPESDLSIALMTDEAWGEGPGAMIFDEMTYGGPGAVDAGGLLNSPIAQIGYVPLSGGGRYYMVGSYNFATANGDGTYTVDWNAEFQAQIDAAANKIYQAFLLIARNQGIDPNQQVMVDVQYRAMTWNVNVDRNDPLSDESLNTPAALANGGWPDPVTSFHGGADSFYFGSLWGFDAGHLIDSTAVLPINAHIDPFGPLNALHYLLQIPSMLLPAGSSGTATCSMAGGCQ